MNRVVFLISLSDDSSFMNRNALDLCVLILYPATLLNSIISSRSFLVEFFGSSKYRTMSLANSDNLSSFPIHIPLISLVCLIALASVSRMILIEVVKEGIPALFQVLGGMLSVFHHLE